ncbi:carbohydrate ABC transporter permease [Halorhabdus sp. CBA1104]|uniref:carbohydrate ABC transporter permease n=1 Tax=Halorhabdus sp. CBA1104 TaxID=1380432 RepID=UPI0012B38F17|nr:carbohydrate ABC transporter permease [Halorhabdus sp. CBA1104]QGN07023.1 carbohydrate ABC transporter permease [Halorhabdus sp. CBA1104]
MFERFRTDQDSGLFADELRLESSARETLFSLLVRVTLVLLLIFALFPFWMMLQTSLKPRSEIALAGFHPIPQAWTIEHYLQMWDVIPLVNYYFNSLLIASVTTVLSLTIAGLAAYAFSRYEFPGKSTFEVSALATQMIPGILILIPMFLLFTFLGQSGIPMKDTYWGMIFLYTTFTVPFAIWMLRGYIDTIPAALEEAARIDGCSRLEALYRIVFPLALPGFAATGMFVFLLAFNEVLFASVMAPNKVTPFAIGIYDFMEAYSTQLGPLMAASTTASLPILIIFVAFNRQIVSGLTAGSVKQ